MTISLSRQNIKKIDRSDMLGILSDFPGQCRASLAIAGNAKVLFDKRDFNKIIFLGMGGSAIGADAVKSYLYSESRLPIVVLREYTLPAYIDSSTLVFASSYSGNTEEILGTYKEARAKGASVVALSSGGALKEEALAGNTTYIEIPKGIPPRCSLGYSSIIPLCILAKLGLIKDAAPYINKMAGVLEELRDKNLNPRIGQKDNIAKAIASGLRNKFAVVYTGSLNFDICATRLRSQLAENSKALSSSYLFPEMTHNEIMGWDNPRKVLKDTVIIMLRDKLMHPHLKKRMDVTGAMLRDAGFKVIEIWSRGEDLLSRIFSLVYIGDFISYYLAILYGIDPTPVDRITYLKKELAKG